MRRHFRWSLIAALGLSIAAAGCKEDASSPPELLGACGGTCGVGQTCSGSSGVCMESCTLAKPAVSKITTTCSSTGATMCSPRKCGGTDAPICTRVCDPKKLGSDCPNHGRGVFCRPAPFIPVISGDLNHSGVVRYVCLPLCPGETPPDAGVDLGPDSAADLGTFDRSSEAGKGLTTGTR